MGKRDFSTRPQAALVEMTTCAQWFIHYVRGSDCEGRSFDAACGLAQDDIRGAMDYSKRDGVILNEVKNLPAAATFLIDSIFIIRRIYRCLLKF